MGNVRSLVDKMDELGAPIRTQPEYHQGSFTPLLYSALRPYEQTERQQVRHQKE